jgi:hypothetical protein
MSRLILFFVLGLCQFTYANDLLKNASVRLLKERERIDLLDGVKDQKVSLGSDLQTQEATEVYLEITENIELAVFNNVFSPGTEKLEQLNKLLEMLENVEAKNINFYAELAGSFKLIRKIQEVENDARLLALLKNDVPSALTIIPFYLHKRPAQTFLEYSAAVEPVLLLRSFDDFAYKPFHVDVINAVCSNAPMKIKSYLHSWNDIHRTVKNSTNPVTKQIYAIYKQKGTVTKSYLLINDIYSKRLSIEEAHQIARKDSSLFNYLIQLKQKDQVLGVHSIEEALESQCLKHVRVINDLHEEPDNKRFASLKPLSAEEIYTLIVYSQEEIYTSTFLGMYKSLMDKLPVQSSYEFLSLVSFNRVRQFISMCAGYNTIDNFLQNASLLEKEQLFKRIVRDLHVSNDNLASAVAVADTYGLLKDGAVKDLLGKTLLDYTDQLPSNNKEAITLYNLILSVLNLRTVNASYAEVATQLGELSIDKLFKDGKNIQQHFFFDDNDGKASYAHFVQTFRNGSWKINDKGSYILITPIKGKAIEIYANKPTQEYAGQDAIKAHFKETKRYPDLVVHRGHSYYVDAAIESLTPNAELVFLGSCGGYNNINNVLHYAPNAHIIASKQIGTMLVNDRVLLTINETLRNGNSLVWDALWSDLTRKFGQGNIAAERFQDYIPPHQNPGALLISSYRKLL